MTTMRGEGDEDDDRRRRMIEGDWASANKPCCCCWRGWCCWLSLLGWGRPGPQGGRGSTTGGGRASAWAERGPVEGWADVNDKAAAKIKCKCNAMLNANLDSNVGGNASAVARLVAWRSGRAGGNGGGGRQQCGGSCGVDGGCVARARWCARAGGVANDGNTTMRSCGDGAVRRWGPTTYDVCRTMVTMNDDDGATGCRARDGDS